MIDEDEVEILSAMGLTNSEATVYLTLAKFRDSTAKELYKATKISRQDVYQVLWKLEEIGLVSRILGKPLKFRATPTKAAISILDRIREDKQSELRNRALILSDLFDKREKIQGSVLPEISFELRNICLSDPHVKAAMGCAKVKIRLLDENMNWPVFYSFIEDWIWALERGVKIEVLNEFSAEIQEPEFVDALKKSKSFEIRYGKNLASGAVLIFDDKEMAIWENSKTKQIAKSESPPVKALWTNHHGLIELTTVYFDSTWEIATSLPRLTLT
jgi:sugar-specific transcriptional regulator TrmB